MFARQEKNHHAQKLFIYPVRLIIPSCAIHLEIYMKKATIGTPSLGDTKSLPVHGTAIGTPSLGDTKHIPALGAPALGDTKHIPLLGAPALGDAKSIPVHGR